MAGYVDRIIDNANDRTLKNAILAAFVAEGFTPDEREDYRTQLAAHKLASRQVSEGTYTFDGYFAGIEEPSSFTVSLTHLRGARFAISYFSDIDNRNERG